MRRSRCVLAVLLILTAACASTPPPLDAPADVVGFLEDFSRAVERGRFEDAVGYFSPEYVAEQHDRFLGGQTGQFLVEALGLHYACPGYAEDERTAFLCLARVCSVRPVAVAGGLQATGRARVRLQVVHRCGAPPFETELTLVRSPDGAAHPYGLVGAVG